MKNSRVEIKNWMKFGLKSRRGMTLVEVLIAAVLVAMIVLAMLAAITQSSIFSKSMDMAYTTANLAQRRIDVLKKLDFDQVSSAGETDVRVNIDGTIDPEGSYSRTTTITPNFDSNSYLTRVTVEVKRLKIGADGAISSTQFGGDITMETLFADVI